MGKVNEIRTSVIFFGNWREFAVLLNTDDPSAV